MNGDERFVGVSEEEARTEGMFMIGQVAVMHDEVTSIAELHTAVSVEGTRLSIEAAQQSATTGSDAIRRAEPIAIIG